MRYTKGRCPRRATVLFAAVTCLSMAGVEALAQESEPDHIQGLRSLDVSERIAAARALGESQEPTAVQALAQSLRSDPNPDVRGWVLRSLQQHDTSEARTAIATAARSDADQRVRALAAQLAPEVVPSPQPQTQPQTQAPVYEYRPQRPQRPPRPPGRGLRVSGWITFGGSYGMAFLLGSIFMAVDSEIAWPMFIPWVGPTINAARALQDDAEVIAAVFGFLSTIVQCGGFAMAIVGHMQRRRARQNEGETTDQARRRISLAVVPTGPGLALAGAF